VKQLRPLFFNVCRTFLPLFTRVISPGPHLTFGAICRAPPHVLAYTPGDPFCPAPSSLFWLVSVNTWNLDSRRSFKVTFLAPILATLNPTPQKHLEAFHMTSFVGGKVTAQESVGSPVFPLSGPLVHLNEVPSPSSHEFVQETNLVVDPPHPLSFSRLCLH